MVKNATLNGRLQALSATAMQDGGVVEEELQGDVAGRIKLDAKTKHDHSNKNNNKRCNRNNKSIVKIWRELQLTAHGEKQQ